MSEIDDLKREIMFLRSLVEAQNKTIEQLLDVVTKQAAAPIMLPPLGPAPVSLPTGPQEWPYRTITVDWRASNTVDCVRLPIDCTNVVAIQ
jgi:hypothetical protein